MDKIISLMDRLERMKLAREKQEQYPLDGLSLSLLQLEDEMFNLDETGIEAMAAEVDGDGRPIMSLEQARAFVDEWRRRREERPSSLQRALEAALTRL